MTRLNPKKRIVHKLKRQVLREDSPAYRTNGRGEHDKLRFIDLFCGIGGFRFAFEKAGCECVFSSDWNKYAQQTYAANFNETPHGDIHSVAVANISAHDILCARISLSAVQHRGCFQEIEFGQGNRLFDDNKNRATYSSRWRKSSNSTSPLRSSWRT